MLGGTVQKGIVPRGMICSELSWGEQCQEEQFREEMIREELCWEELWRGIVRGGIVLQPTKVHLLKPGFLLFRQIVRRSKIVFTKNRKILKEGQR